MANVYTQINIHSVFAVKGRHNLLPANIRPRVFEYISGLMKKNDLFPLAVNGWQDHVHVFFEIKPDISLSKAMKLIKANSSKWINDHSFVKGKFEWQRGYGRFSYSRSQRNGVIRYIMQQQEHHRAKGKSFKKEYLDLLEGFGIKYDSRFLFDFLDE